MNIIYSYTSGVKSVFYVKKIVFVIYLLNLIFALVVAIPFASVLSTAIGFSDALTSLAVSFNYTAYADFMREKGDALAGIFSVGRWLVPVYILLQDFLNGGIIGAFSQDHESYSLSNFYKNCTTYFWRYLKVFFGFLVFHIVAIMLIVIPLIIIFKGGIDEVESEITYWTAGYWVMGIYFILFTLIMVVSDYTKILLTKDDSKGVFKTIFKAWKLVFQHLIKMYSLFLINFLVIACFYWLYGKIGDGINPGSIGMAFVLILIQQFFNIIRVYAKLTYYSSMIILTKGYN